MLKITDKDYDVEIASQSIQFQIDNYYEPKEKFWKDRIRRVLKVLKPTRGDLILDFGWRVGTFAFHSAKAGADSIGIDFSQQAIDITKEIVSRYKIPGKVDATLKLKSNIISQSIPLLSVGFFHHSVDS